jgi:hypothetical protein
LEASVFFGVELPLNAASAAFFANAAYNCLALATGYETVCEKEWVCLLVVTIRFALVDLPCGLSRPLQ